MFEWTIENQDTVFSHMHTHTNTITKYKDVKITDKWRPQCNIPNGHHGLNELIVSLIFTDFVKCGGEQFKLLLHYEKVFNNTCWLVSSDLPFR